MLSLCQVYNYIIWRVSVAQPLWRTIKRSPQQCHQLPLLWLLLNYLRLLINLIISIFTKWPSASEWMENSFHLKSTHRHQLPTTPAQKCLPCPLLPLHPRVREVLALHSQHCQLFLRSHYPSSFLLMAFWLRSLDRDHTQVLKVPSLLSRQVHNLPKQHSFYFYKSAYSFDPVFFFKWVSISGLLPFSYLIWNISLDQPNSQEKSVVLSPQVLAA